MKYHFRKFKPADAKILAKLIMALYREDSTDQSMTPQKISRTIRELSKHPSRGVILVFEADKKVVGYCILINFWSNEYGGNTLFVDELYIVPAYRNRGIGTSLIKFLIKSRFNKLVGIQLEVSRANQKAKRFYKKLGFKPAGRIRQAMYLNKYYHDHYFMDLLKDEYLKNNSKKYGKRKKIR